MTDISRRGLLAASASAAVLSGCATGAKQPVESSPDTKAWTPDATELASRLRNKEVSAVELMDATIRKAEALQGRLGFLVNSDFDRAMDRARAGGQSGPFAGVPFLVKDLDDAIG
ncbi:MAG: 6-aminohexanoate hydrolase, partial [Caulobacteraceae bacterium]|nr:6-aminohexanoate hydrolase [Caulobacteraceae bacterium]